MRVDFDGFLDFLQGIHELLHPYVANRDVGFVDVLPAYIKSLVKKDDGFVVFLESKLLLSLLVETALFLSLMIPLVAVLEFLTSVVLRRAIEFVVGIGPVIVLRVGSVEGPGTLVAMMRRSFVEVEGVVVVGVLGSGLAPGVLAHLFCEILAPFAHASAPIADVVADITQISSEVIHEISKLIHSLVEGGPKPTALIISSVSRHYNFNYLLISELFSSWFLGKLHLIISRFLCLFWKSTWKLAGFIWGIDSFRLISFCWFCSEFLMYFVRNESYPEEVSVFSVTFLDCVFAQVFRISLSCHPASSNDSLFSFACSSSVS